MGEIFSSEAKCRSASQENSRVLWNLQDHYRVHKSRKISVKVKGPVRWLATMMFYDVLLDFCPASELRGLLLAGCPRLLIQYRPVRRCPQYLYDVSIHILRTHHAAVTRDLLTFETQRRMLEPRD
jgi:hypothetical protein